jgi:hypothetical protein
MGDICLKTKDSKHVYEEWKVCVHCGYKKKEGDIKKQVKIKIPGMEKHERFEANQQEVEEDTYKYKTGDVVVDACLEAPRALNGQHVFSKNDPNKKCIYCGEENPDAVPPEPETARNAKPACPGTPTPSMDTVNALMCTFQMYGHILAAQARIDGMNIDNTLRLANSCGVVNYGESSFQQEATNIESYARYLRVMQRGDFKDKFTPGT